MHSDFISKLLHGITAAHMLHLLAKGPGSYARHKALGTLYSSLSDLADSLAEECFGVHGVPSAFPSEKYVCPKDPVKFVEELYEYVSRNRSQMGDESHIQNSIDSILTLLATTKYKLVNLA
jgi:DNA-binding ferritin-like protein